jgi:hypothetical protein
MSGAFGKRDGDVLKLFKKTLSVNGFSPSFRIKKRDAIPVVLHFLPEKSGTRLADVQKAAGSKGCGVTKGCGVRLGIFGLFW